MLVRIDASSFDRQNLPNCYKASNNFTVSYKLHSIDQIQQIKGLLQSIANATPVYLTRTPTGKRLLQLPPVPKSASQIIYHHESAFGLPEPLLGNANRVDLPR